MILFMFLTGNFCNNTKIDDYNFPQAVFGQFSYSKELCLNGINGKVQLMPSLNKKYDDYYYYYCNDINVIAQIILTNVNCENILFTLLLIITKVIKALTLHCTIFHYFEHFQIFCHKLLVSSLCLDHSWISAGLRSVLGSECFIRHVSEARLYLDPRHNWWRCE